MSASSVYKENTKFNLVEFKNDTLEQNDYKRAYDLAIKYFPQDITSPNNKESRISKISDLPKITEKFELFQDMPEYKKGGLSRIFNIREILCTIGGYTPEDCNTTLDS